jgi:hypothetical protein
MEVASMGRTRLFLAFALLTIPASAFALQLRWSDGWTNLSVASDSVATLLLVPDSAEVSIPPSWEWVWTADSLPPDFLASTLANPCGGETALASSIDPALTAADSAANLVTAHFCSAGASRAPGASLSVRIPAGGRGKLMAVAVSPDDSTLVLTSNEVTFNGGTDAGYTPTILSASYTHSDEQLTVRAIGIGLDATSAASLQAPDGSWRFPLALQSSSASTLIASGSSIAPVPSCVLSASVGGEQTVAARLTPEESGLPTMPDTYSSCQDVAYGYNPRDFAFVVTPGKLHCIFIRYNHTGVLESQNERNFGHRWTSDFVTWHQDLPADSSILSVSDGASWEDSHVWAPTIVQQGLTYYMFYTGVHENTSTGFLEQQMGLARSTDLSHWTRNGPPVLSEGVIPWADRSTQRQLDFRDPFVMPDPTRPAGWLMYYVANVRNRIPQMAVGVAQSHDDTLGGAWDPLPLPLLVTEAAHTYDNTAESPHVFWSHGRWQMLWTTRSGHPLSIAMNYGAPFDTLPGDSSNWTSPGSTRFYYYLRDSAQDDQTTLIMDPWAGSEYCTIGSREFIGAYDGSGIRISELKWRGGFPDYFALDDPRAGVPQASLPGPLMLRLLSSNPVRGPVRFAVHGGTLGSRAEVRIYDVGGRLLETLADNGLPVGGTIVWSGRAPDGSPASPGVYFARVRSGRESSSLRFVVLR